MTMAVAEEVGNAKSCAALVKIRTGSASRAKEIVGGTERLAKDQFAETSAANCDPPASTRTNWGNKAKEIVAGIGRLVEEVDRPGQHAPKDQQKARRRKPAGFSPRVT